MRKTRKKASSAGSRPRATIAVDDLNKYYVQGRSELWNVSDAKHYPHMVVYGTKVYLPKSAWQKTKYDKDDYASFLQKASVDELKQELRFQEFSYAQTKNTKYEYQKRDLLSIEDAITRVKKELKNRARPHNKIMTGIRSLFGKTK